MNILSDVCGTPPGIQYPENAWSVPGGSEMRVERPKQEGAEVLKPPPPGSD